jgi:hypothetical protein
MVQPPSEIKILKLASCGPMAYERHMENNRFETPVTVKADAEGKILLLRSAKDASDFLLSSWPGKRSPKHRAALQACHDAIAGDKPAMTARRAFVAAAREVDVFVNDKA